MSRITIDFAHSKGVINPNLFGHFTEHLGSVFYEGLWAGENSKIENIRGWRKDAVESFKKINPPVVRWPGGCFAEIYDWRDGIGPREKRPKRVNWWFHADGRPETNQVGTHEFIDFCRLVGAEPYFAANMTTVTPLHIRDWIEYCNMPAGVTTLADERAANGAMEPFNVRFWGIGNENWGGGGHMTAERCADEFIRFTTICMSLGMKDLRFVMCGGNADDFEWTRRMMARWSGRKWHETPAYGMSVHYYTNAHGSDDLEFDEDGWYDELFRAGYMADVIDGHRAAMDEFDPRREIKILVDEWGNWHRDGSGPSKGANLFEQQSNMRDAVVAALTLNIFANRCDIVDMANVAQLCNTIHSLYLISGENFVETTNYHVFDMYKGHQGGKQLNVIADAGEVERAGYKPMERISAAASVKDGKLTLTLANISLTEAQTVELGALGGSLAGEAELSVLSSADPNACNTFESPKAIVPETKKLTISEGSSIVLPAAGIAALTIALKD